jgi:hypothetical protein
VTVTLKVVEHADDVTMVDLVHYADFSPNLAQHVVLLDLVLVNFFDCKYSARVFVCDAVHFTVCTLFLSPLALNTMKSFHSKSSSFAVLSRGNINL